MRQSGRRNSNQANISRPAHHKVPQNTTTKMALRAIGAILIIIGLIIIVLGVLQESSKSMEEEGWFEESSAGMFKMFAGGGLILFGIVLTYISFIGRVASYYADEVSPAIKTASAAAGSGISRGIHRGGGIKLEIDGSRPSRASPRTKEIIRIKCRNWGYLDTEDAKSCIKCGKRL